MRKQKLYFLAAFSYMGFIFFLSSRSDGGGVNIPAPWDKLAHAAEYAILGYLLYRGLGWAKGTWILAWGISVLYGLSDEIHQSFVPGRDASVWDFIADAVGAMAGAWLALFFGRTTPLDARSRSGDDRLG